MSDLDIHCRQQSYIADLVAKGVCHGGILACLALRWGSKPAKAAMWFYVAKQIATCDFDRDCDDSSAQALPARICGEAA